MKYKVGDLVEISQEANMDRGHHIVITNVREDTTSYYGTDVKTGWTVGVPEKFIATKIHWTMEDVERDFKERGIPLEEILKGVEVTFSNHD